jgi:predicted short-subunit dehydrogenase-like oxidoreductase (DUF2520 family)
MVSARDLSAALGPVEIAFVAVSDPAVHEVAGRLADLLPPATAIVHVSGPLALSALDGARAGGRAIGSFHPFQSFPVERPPRAFAGSLIGIDASDGELAERLAVLARDLGGVPRRVRDPERALYHVAAVLSSNLVLGLIGSAVTVLESIGWSRGEAIAALLSLQTGVLSNIQSEGLEGALSGPIRRGDPATVLGHLEALEGSGLEEIARIYRILALATLDLAIRTGLDPVKGDQIREALTGWPAATGGDQ